MKESGDQRVKAALPLGLGLAVGIIAGGLASGLFVHTMDRTDDPARALARVLAEYPDVLIPAQRHELTHDPSVSLDPFPAEDTTLLGVTFRSPEVLEVERTTAELARLEAGDGSITVTVFRDRRCPPEREYLYHLLPRMLHLDEELARLGPHRLVTALAALRAVGSPVEGPRFPRSLHDEISIGGDRGYLTSSVGRTERGDRRFHLDLYLGAAGEGVKLVTFLATAVDPRFTEDTMIRMARSVRADDTTVLQCRWRRWPDDPDQLADELLEERARPTPVLSYSP